MNITVYDYSNKLSQFLSETSDRFVQYCTCSDSEYNSLFLPITFPLNLETYQYRSVELPRGNLSSLKIQRNEETPVELSDTYSSRVKAYNERRFRSNFLRIYEMLTEILISFIIGSGICSPFVIIHRSFTHTCVCLPNYTNRCYFTI